MVDQSILTGEWSITHIKLHMVGGFNHLENMKVNWKDYPIYPYIMGK